MALISAILWVLGFTFSVVIAPQLRIWTWGPTMLCFSLSTLVALPVVWRERKQTGDAFIVATGFLLVLWLGIRATVSPVQELGQSDLLLVAMAIATFVSFRAVAENIQAQRVLYCGIALLTAASLYVIARQIYQPGYSPVFPSGRGLPAGFFAHYSYGASFLIAVSPILLGLALNNKERPTVRILLALIAILALVGVYYTRSRGAIFGAMGGIGTLVAFAFIIGKRDKKKWFAPAIVAAPFILALLGYFLYLAWFKTQEARSGEGDITVMLDNTIRFYLAGIALSCFALHPFFGGGARSYSWESYRFWSNEAMGIAKSKPEHVHNELLQTATDYGILGAGLLVVFLICVTTVAIFRSASRDTTSSSSLADGWRIGGIAGLTALFIQSNFEGIFRIAPGAIALALCVSAACFPKKITGFEGQDHIAWFRTGLVTSVAAISMVLLFAFGIKGTRVSIVLWPSFFGSDQVGKESRLDALDSAIDIWPLYTLYRERAHIKQKLASEETSPETKSHLIESAVADFQKVEELHPYDPAAFVKSGNLLSLSGRFDEAEKSFNRAIELQGEMEETFHSHYNAALHYQRKALKIYDPEDVASSLLATQIAATHIEKANNFIVKRRQIRVTIHQNYGRLLAAHGEPGNAMAAFDFAATLREGRSSNYLAALLYRKLAVDSWFEKRSPEDALYFFKKALERTRKAGNSLPDKVTKTQLEEHTNYLKNSIKTLEAGQIKQSDSVDF